MKYKKFKFKKLVSLSCVGIIFCTACASPYKSSEYDIDLYNASSTVIYSQIYNIVTDPDKYVGTSVRLEGNFACYSVEKTGRTYFAAVVPDATACCEQGIEFLTKDDLKYPDDYPESGADIIVTGVYQKYDDDGVGGYRLEDATMTVTGKDIPDTVAD